MAGRPPLFENADQLSQAIADYFDLHPDDATITGLALYLGFSDRQSLYDYEKKPEYSCIIKTARLQVENGYELALRSKAYPGAIFALKNMGWRDKVETGFTDSEGKDVRPQFIFQPAPNCKPIACEEPPAQPPK